ncbi:MAG: InlB B-repeat-containing protein [Treponema sp.]|jgi:uncharacterized repeat protein (TIGR02543 family)|nr:InlB B-repeat-containing protein [Treponema sp.]
MKSDMHKKRLGTALSAALLAALCATLCAGILLFAGCKDLFHPEGSEECAVTFYAEDGSSGYLKRVTVKIGETVGSNMPGNPSRSGQTFGGWYTQRNGGGSQFTSSTTVTGDIRVYAKWTAVQYTVTFDADGGSFSGGSATQTKTVTSGGSVGLPANPTKRGSTFGGWYTQRNGGGSPFTSSTTVTATIRVYAKWTAVRIG